FGERCARLDDHHDLLTALDFALPPVVRDHPGQDIDAGRKAPLQHGLPDPLRLDKGWIGRIDENRALGVHEHPPSGRLREAARPRPMTNSRHPRIAFVASPIAEAEDARARLAKRYGDTAPGEADVIVALGGDGLMLQTLHRFMTSGK